MDLITYTLCKKIAAGAVSGISNLTVENTTLKITTNEGNIVEMNFPTPQDGISIADIKINEKNHLICTLSDDTEIDAGEISTIAGKTPVKGVDYFTDNEIQAIVQEAQQSMKLEIF